MLVKVPKYNVEAYKKACEFCFLLQKIILNYKVACFSYIVALKTLSDQEANAFEAYIATQVMDAYKYRHIKKKK